MGATAENVVRPASPPPPPTATYTCPAIDAIYGRGAEAKLRNTRLLVVGAGGVGCELLKNLVSLSVAHITVIDLDIIDFSNLNRQFLFRRRHVGLAKATEAASSIMTMLPTARKDTVIGTYGNIKDVAFDVHFFKSFNVVCNALDNLDARRHVNRMCLAAGVPLVDSGSTGYLGQCEVYAGGFECYDCIERPPQKSYAVCTIRSTPEKPVHCVVWAKYLFDLIFAGPDADNVLSDLDGNAAAVAAAAATDDGTAENGSVENGTQENEEEKEKEVDDSTTMGADTNGHDCENENEDEKKNQSSPAKRIRFLETDTPETFSDRLVARVFMDDINEQRRMTSLWTSRAAPVPQDVKKLCKRQEPLTLSSVDCLSQATWTAEYSACVLLSVLQHMSTERRGDIGSVKFDKDDREALLFVTAASNLRAGAYGVDLQSPFHVKGIAGNIVHAVATTNAMVAGLVSMEAVRLVVNGGDVSKCKKTLISRSVLGSRVCSILQTDPMRKANAKCFVCSGGQASIEVDVHAMTLAELIKGVCKGRMGVREPIVDIVTGELQNTVHESGVGLEEEEVQHYEMLGKKHLAELKVGSGSQILITDLVRSDIKVTLHVRHVSGLKQELKAEERFTVFGEVGSASAQQHKEDNTEQEQGADDVDEITWVEDVDKSRPDWGLLEAKQRQTEQEEEGQRTIMAAKKRGLNVKVGDEVEEPDTKRDTKRLKSA